jgi:hypothetical protein
MSPFFFFFFFFFLFVGFFGFFFLPSPFPFSSSCHCFVIFLSTMSGQQRFPPQECVCVAWSVSMGWPILLPSIPSNVRSSSWGVTLFRQIRPFSCYRCQIPNDKNEQNGFCRPSLVMHMFTSLVCPPPPFPPHALTRMLKRFHAPSNRTPPPQGMPSNTSGPWHTLAPISCTVAICPTCTHPNPCFSTPWRYVCAGVLL